jgi:quinol monooxygenase YgiN
MDLPRCSILDAPYNGKGGKGEKGRKRNMAKLTVVAKIVAKRESVENVKSELLKIIPPTRKEDGCISYNLFQDNENSAVFFFVENWESAEHLEKHMNTAHFKNLGAAIGGITEGMAINKLTKLD